MRTGRVHGLFSQGGLAAFGIIGASLCAMTWLKEMQGSREVRIAAAHKRRAQQLQAATSAPSANPSTAAAAQMSSLISSLTSLTNVTIRPRSPDCEEPSNAGYWNPIKNNPCTSGPTGPEGGPLWFFFLIWLFAGIAVVTDVYFTPSLEAISNALDLSEDVAGATFLAAASSAPELAVSVADTFTVGDGGEGYGIGTIVGSAVFNILVIVALSCIPCDRLSLDWYPLARDACFYTISLILLLAAISTHKKPKYNTIGQADGNVGEVHWWEALLFVLGYAAYISYMKFSGSLRPHAQKLKDRIFGTVEEMPSEKREASDGRRRSSARLPTPRARKVWEKRHSQAQEATCEMREATDPEKRGSGSKRQSGDKNGSGPAAPKPLVAENGTDPEQDKAGSEKGGDDGEEDEYEVTEIKLKKKEWKELQEAGVLVLGDEEEEDNVYVKVLTWAPPKDAGTAGEAGFVEEMTIARINNKKVTQLRDIEVILEELETGADITITTHLTIEDPFWDWDWPDSTVKKVLWALLIPLLFLFKCTIPNASRRATKKYFWFSFGHSIIWIGLISMFMLKMAGWLSNIMHIHPTVTAVVVVAAGTSVPDAMGSYSAAKMGLADMAVSNALGSNVFNIFAGLGIPWLVSTLVECGKGECKPIRVPSDNILVPSLILFFVLFFFLGTLGFFKMTLQPKVGKLFMFMMVLYWAWNITNELVLNTGDTRCECD